MSKSGKQKIVWNESWYFYIITTAVFAFVGLALGQFTVGFLVSVILKLISGFYPSLNDDVVKVITRNYSFAVTLLLLTVYAHKREKKKLRELWCSGEHKGREVFIGVLLGFFMSLAAIMMAVFFGKWKLDFCSVDVLVVVLMLTSAVIQASVEEILFRGYLMKGLGKHYSINFSIIISGLVFSLTHIINPGITVLAMVNITVIGIVLSCLAAERKSIYMAAGIHIMWNFTEEVIFGTPNSGIVFPKSIFQLTGGESNWFYNQRFGVEGAVQTLLLWALLLVLFRTYKQRKVV